MVYKCSSCGGVLMFDPETGKMKCNQCGNYEEAGSRLHLKEEPEETAVKEDEDDGMSRSFEDLWYGFKPEQKWHGEKEIDVNPSWDADISLEEHKDELPDYYDENTTYMEVNIFKCTSCGAKLIMNQNEKATFCAHCGQPTVVFDKASEEAEPDYIIPFKISEQQAVNLIKEKFGKGFFVPDEIKNLQIDKVRGIYIPYWLYTVYIRKKANLKKRTDADDPEYSRYARKNNPLLTKGMYPGSISDRKKSKSAMEIPVGFYGDKYVDVNYTFEKIGIDASRKLSNSLSEILEPFDMRGLQKFEPELLSGFYADKYDVPSREAASALHQKVNDAVNKAILADTDCDYIFKEIEQYSVDSIECALLPVWFMTFWYKKKLYTVLVNGQTGKVVGDLPVRKDRMGYCFAVSATFLCMVMTFLSVTFGREIALGNNWILEYGYSDYYFDVMANGFRFIAFLIVLAVICFASQYRKYTKYKTDLEKLAAGSTTKYARERQDKTWVR